MADENRPYIGYRSAGRRPEAQQDRRAAADAPLSALRGMVSGVLGAPGDIESLIRMLPGLSEQTVLPTSEDIEKRLPFRELNQTPTGRAFTTAGQLGGGFYTGPGAPLRAVAALPSAVSRAGRDFAMAAGQPAVNVVKPKGGNWLAGSVERAIEPMIPRTGAGNRVARDTLEEMNRTYPSDVVAGMSPETRASIDRAYEWLNPNVAMQDWLEKKLAKYIRNEMATPEDPIRALAESWPARQQELLAAKQVQIDKAVADMEKARAARGFTPEMMTSSQARIRELEKERELIAAREGLHSEIGPTGYSLKGPRAMAGFPEEGMGVSPLAKTWEDRADTFINQLHASDLTRGYPEAVEANPWLAKVPPQTRVYEMLRGAEEDLGFTHLADELRNALNPSSVLPPELLLKYTDLEKKTVPDIVNQVADINAWRAVQKAEVDKARASNVATQIFKEYPESPQGLRWVELRQPKETGKKATVQRSELDDFEMGVDDATVREVAEEMAWDEGLEEGTQAFDDFVNDTIRLHNTKRPVEVDESVKALEDALKYEGEVLQHCVGGYCPDVVEGRSRIFSLRDEKGQPYVTIETTPSGNNSIKSLKENSPQNFDIVQIKGKKNQAPASEYLPYVQDFVRSGNFGKIGDLQNTGLVQLPDKRLITNEQFDEAISRISDGGDRPTNEWFMNVMRGDPSWWEEMKGAFEGFSNGGAVRGYKAGGVVRSLEDLHQRYAEGGQVSGANFPTDDFDPARIDAIVGELHALNAG